MKPRGRRLGVAFALSAGLAGADPAPSIDLRGFRPPMHPQGSLALESTKTQGAGEFSTSAWFSYARRPVILSDAEGAQLAIPVKHQVSLDYLASVGVGDRLDLGLVIPTVLWQNGDDTTETLTNGGPLPATALGDLAFRAKAALIRPGALGGFGLSARATATAPTGNQRSSISENAPTGSFELLGELQLIALALRGSAGATVRANEQAYPNDQTVFGNELPWALGISFKPQVLGLDPHGRWLWFAEARGRLAMTPDFGASDRSPKAAAVSARHSRGDVSLIGGVELPLDSAAGNPLPRVVLGIGWAPRFYDADGDGIADDDDECMELAEDRDGFQDSDGCPDFDNDDDGVYDEDDRCPAEKEDEDGHDDDDGCIDPDDDGDGVPDVADRCPREAGTDRSPERLGCPIGDRDQDGVLDDRDACPDVPEDLDEHEDSDGCPDPDNDDDGIPDSLDRCPLTAGLPLNQSELWGCPSPDTDGDTFIGDADQCPDAAEDFDGKQDDDGCPDDESTEPEWKRGRPLLTLVDGAPEWRIRPRFEERDGRLLVDAATLASLRALAAELTRRKHVVAIVGVRPSRADAAAVQTAADQSFALALLLRAFTLRDDLAEPASFAAVSDAPGASRSGVGVRFIPTVRESAAPGDPATPATHTTPATPPATESSAPTKALPSKPPETPPPPTPLRAPAP